MAWRKAKNGNKCSCCSSSSSSSSSGSSSGSGSDSSSSSESVSFSDSSSSSSDSASSSESVGPTYGKCCAIPTDYIVTSEIFPSNQFDEAEGWIRSQRNGREGVGFLFHGPIRLRFDGGWFVAVVCVGKLQEDGTCECNDADDPDSYTCEETRDPGYCYYLSGIPGLGVFTENSGCNCNNTEDENCNDCSGTFQECEIGCTESGCGCCYEPRPPATEDGVACSKRFMVLSYADIQEQYPEIVQDTDCHQPDKAADGSVLQRMVNDLVDQKDVLRNSIKVANMRDDNEPCRIEVWAECDCTPEASCEGPCVKKECYDKAVVQVDVFDEWQANQLGMEWKDPAIEGNCPDACSKGYACIYPCYKGMLSGCENFATEEEAIACVSFVDPENPGASWPARGYLPVAIECSPGSWSGAIVCCYDCAGFGDLCFVCLSGAGNPDFPQGGDAQRDPDWEDDIYCQGFGSEEEAAKNNCRDGGIGTPTTNAYREVLAWYTEEDAPEGCDTPEICDGPWDDEQNRKFDVAIEKALKEREKAEVETRALPAGPGTELKKLLKIFGLPDRPGCKCNKRAKTMDSWGPDKCSEPDRLTEIVGWLKEEATKQKVPFVEWAARVIVKRAIRNSRKVK